MALIPFIDTPRFPEDISYGSRGGPQFFTQVARVQSGRETRDSKWQYPLHAYDVGYGARTLPQLDIVMDHFYVARGRAAGWRYKDWRDYKSTAHMEDAIDDDQDLGVGDGIEVDYQLIKTYTRGAVTLVRKITRPVTGTVRIWLDGVEQMSGWTVDTTTGIVTFSVAPAGTVRVSAGYEFDVPCRFTDDSIQQSILACDAGDFGQIPIEEIRE